MFEILKIPRLQEFLYHHEVSFFIIDSYMLISNINENGYETVIKSCLSQLSQRNFPFKKLFLT